jgi:hypothetical protein
MKLTSINSLIPLLTILAIGVCETTVAGELCAPIRQNLYAPLNDWVIDQLKRPVKKEKLQYVGWHMISCNVINSSLDQRFLFQNELFNVSLNGIDLCATEPHIYIDASKIPSDQAYRSIFTDHNNQLTDAHWLIGKLIKKQCSTVQNNITIEIIAPKHTVEVLNAKRKAKTRKDVINLINLNNTYSEGYATAYKGTFSYENFLIQGKLFDDGLKDEAAYVEVKQETIAKVNAEKEAIRKLREDQDKWLKSIMDPLIILLQTSTYQFADEGICFFFYNTKRSFSSTEYKRCHDALNNDIERAERDNPELQQLLNLSASMEKIKKYIKSSKNNSLAPIYKACAEDYISLIGSKRSGEDIDHNEAIKACAF